MNVGDLVTLSVGTYDKEFVDDWGLGIVVSYSKSFRTVDVWWFKQEVYRIFIDVVLEVV